MSKALVDYLTVGECCDILDSLRVPITANQRSKGIYPYYGANGIQDFVDDFIFDDELVLVAEDGGHFGSKERPIAYRVSGKCWVNNHAHVLKPHDNINVDYLCYSLMYYPVLSLIKGATRKKLNQADLKQMKIIYRPLNVQEAIVTLLKSIDKSIMICQTQLTKLDELVKSRFIEMFGDIKLNTKKWKTVKLDSIADVGSSKRVFVEELLPEGIPFYRGTEIGAWAEGKPIIPELHITEEHYKSLCEASGTPQKGDLLMPSICPDGRIWLVDTDEPFYFKDGRVLWVHLTSTDFNNVFLQYVMKSKMATEYEHIASGTTFKELKIFTLKSLDIVMPPINLQNQFADFVQQADKSKLVAKILLERCELLREKLMQDYFC